MNAPRAFGQLPPSPDPVLHTVENDTPFPHLAFDKMGKGRLFYDIIVCKATFTLAPGRLQPAEDAQPIALADRYWDEEHAETSSLKIAGDVVLTKPGADLLITGTARPFDGKPRKEWFAGVRLSRDGQPVAEHRLRLLGPRFWRHRLLRGWKLSRPEPTDAVELRHERAYGGHYPARAPKEGEPPEDVYAVNPSGCGYWDIKRLDKGCPHPAAQIETLGQPVETMDADYPLAAPSPVARFWADRTRYGGTYDEAWMAHYTTSPIPDFPADFDNRFFQCAHPNLITAQPLHGDETLVLAYLVPGKDEGLACRLPGIGVRAELIAADGRVGERDLLLDTVHVDLDAKTVALTWRLTLDQRGGIEQARLFTQPLSEVAR